jgi:hypothetical protein
LNNDGPDHKSLFASRPAAAFFSEKKCFLLGYLGAKISHQPAGFIGPATILQRLAGTPFSLGLKIK